MVIFRDVVFFIVRFAFARLNLLYDRKFIAEIDIFITLYCNFCNVNIEGCFCGFTRFENFFVFGGKSLFWS